MHRQNFCLWRDRYFSRHSQGGTAADVPVITGIFFLSSQWMSLAWNCLQINPGFLAPNITPGVSALCQNRNCASNSAITDSGAASLSCVPWKVQRPWQAVICGYFPHHMLLSWETFVFKCTCIFSMGIVLSNLDTSGYMLCLNTLWMVASCKPHFCNVFYVSVNCVHMKRAIIYFSWTHFS